MSEKAAQSVEYEMRNLCSVRCVEGRGSVDLNRRLVVRYCNIDQKRAKIIGFSLVCRERVLGAWMSTYLANLATGDACECTGTSRRALHIPGYASSTPVRRSNWHSHPYMCDGTINLSRT